MVFITHGNEIDDFVSISQAGSLVDFYGLCRGLELTRNFQFPVLREVRMDSNESFA